MRLSLSETATVLGKSERQLRYLVKNGSVPAQKLGNRWVFESGDLPLTARQREALSQRIENTREVFEAGLRPFEKAAAPPTAPEPPPTAKEHFSVTQLGAFEPARQLLQAAREQLPAEHPACRLLFAVVAHLTRGCHAFHREAKARSFALARDAASTALAHLLVESGGGAAACVTFSQTVEQELIPRLSGLIAAHERRSPRNRFERFGAGTK